MSSVLNPRRGDCATRRQLADSLPQSRLLVPLMSHTVVAIMSIETTMMVIKPAGPIFELDICCYLAGLLSISSTIPYSTACSGLR